MRRLLLAALLLLAGLAGSAQAASTINSLPPITDGTFPLTDPGCPATSTENFWVTQGTGDFKIDALRSGYIFQGSTAPSCPFKYELWWNTAPTLPELDAYDGAQWLRITSIDASNHLLVPPIGGGVISPITSASTTDLCSQAPATVQVTGAATINAFGPTCPTGTIKFVNFASTPTIVYNGTSMILPGGANITVTAGETWLVESLGSGNWQLFFRQVAAASVTSVFGRTGAIAAQAGDYSFSQISGTVVNSQLPTMAPVGSATNIRGSLASPAVSITITADDVVVGVSLTGTTYTLGSYSQLFNSGVVGAGGMDTNTFPASGNVCLYAIYNPVAQTQSILGADCTSSSGTIYSGGHFPAGYTASALLVKWATDATPDMVAGTIPAPLPFVIPATPAVPSIPSGRLTLATATPVMASTVSGATTIYYTPYNGNTVPVWNTTTNAWTVLACPELSNITTNSATGNAGPAAVIADVNYDLYVWSNNGVCTLTRGQAWATNTTRSQGLVRLNGILVNAPTITNGPVAEQGTFVGTVHSNGSATIDYIFGGSASGGTACSFEVWNEYNRVLTPCIVTDSGTGYTYSSGTVREARGSTTNQGSFLSGLQEDGITATYLEQTLTANAAAPVYTITGIGFDSTTSFSCQVNISNSSVTGFSNYALSQMATCAIPAQIGAHTIIANEQGDGTNANQFDSSSLNQLSFIVRN